MKIVPMKVELVDSMGTDLSIVNAARVSFHKTHDEIQENDPKLITYLAKHGHWTPFAHAFLSFRIKAPIFVARQLVKHQVGLAWNEVSRRYVDEEPEFWFPEVWRGKPVNAKQGSSDVTINSNDESLWVDTGETVVDHTDLTGILLSWYVNAIKQGVAPEQARMILPQNTMTEWIWSGSLAAFARVCKLRLDPHAQQETQMVAQQINDLVPDSFTHSWKALMEN
jgi:thymidylate synthase (FAD)